MNETVYRTKEQRLIAAIKDWTDERLIGDDCAVLPGRELVTADTLVQSVHFMIPGISFEDLGWKAMAVNLSDIAAMAGRPRYAVVSLALPGWVTELQVEKLYAGLVECARAYRCRIVGGDLTRSSEIVISITVIGEAHENGVLLRSGALAGDILVVTGDFGASAAGLWLMNNNVAGFDYCRRRHFRPLPRLCESWSLVRQTGGRGALMDASDGLADALVQISTLSGVGVHVSAGKIPVSQATREVAALAGVDALEWALYGGEDYELVGTLSAQDWDRLQGTRDNPFVAIGTLTDEAGTVQLGKADGSSERITLERSFQHWA